MRREDLHERAERLRAEIRKSQKEQMIRSKRLQLEKSTELQIDKGCFEEEYMLSLLREPKDSERINLFTRILSDLEMSQHSRQSLFFKQSVIQSLFQTIEQNLPCFTLCYMLYLHSIDDENLNNRLVDKCIQMMDKNDPGLNKNCLVLIDSMTSRSKFTHSFNKFLKEIPKWIDKLGLLPQIIYIVCGLSCFCLLADSHICFQVIEGGLAIEDKTMKFGVLNLATHLLTLKGANLTNDQLLKIANWSWKMINTQDRYQERQGCQNFVRLLAINGWLINKWFLENHILNTIQLRINSGKACNRLLYFRIISEWLVKCPPEFSRNVENCCLNIVYTVFDYAINSNDLNLVYEGLKLTWTMLSCGGGKYDNRNLQALLQIYHVVETIESRQYCQDQEIAQLAQKICTAYLTKMEIE